MRTSTLLWAWSLVALPAAAADRAFPFAVQEKTLANGLRLYAIPCDSPGIVSYFSVVRTGSRQEIEPGRSGFAHFFEHMMFRGTPTYPEGAYNSALKRIGADSNAWTWRDQTVYHITATASALPLLVALEADRFQHLTYAEPDFQKEARAVLGEYNKSVADPSMAMEEALANAAFTTHTYRHTTIGFLKDIEGMPALFDYSRTFFDRWYRPENVVVIVAGDVQPAALFAEAEKHYGGWKRGEATPPIPVEPPQDQERRVALKWSQPTVPQLVVGWKVPAFSTEDRDAAALEVLADVVFSERAPLYRTLVLETQTADSLSASPAQSVDPFLFTVWVKVKEIKDMAAVEAAIYAALAQVATQGVDPRTLDEIKRRARYGFAASLSTAEGVASKAAWYVSLTGRIESINAWQDQLAAVTVDDLKRVAARYFVPAGRTVVTVVPDTRPPEVK